MLKQCAETNVKQELYLLLWNRFPEKTPHPPFLLQPTSGVSKLWWQRQ